MTTYIEWQPSLHPTPLRGRWGTAWGASLGAAKDTALSLAKDAVKAGFVALAPGDALPELAADVQIDHVPGETDDSWRERIRGAWDSWAWAGTRYGIAYAVGLLGFGTPAVWTQAELPREGPAGTWARLTLLFFGVAGWDGAVWDGFDWDAREVQPIEGALTASTRGQLRRVLRQWINARDHVSSVIVGFGTTLWDLDVWDGFDWDDGDADPVTWEAPAWDSSEATWDGDDLFVWDYFI